MSEALLAAADKGEIATVVNLIEEGGMDADSRDYVRILDKLYILKPSRS